MRTLRSGAEGTRARFIAQGLPCEMEELGELLCYKCRSEAKNRGALC